MLDPTSLPPLLDLRGLRVEVGGHVAVDGVDLVVRPGERWGLIGESGAGKSITAAVAAALPPPGAVLGGSARVGGVELVGAGEATLTACRGRVVTLVAQDVAAALHPLLPAGRQVTAALRRHAGLSRAAAAAGARELLAEVGLPVSVADARPAQLSGGQRQRVALAAALACGAPLLVADEPTAALDPAVARDLLAQLDTSLRRGGDGGGRATALLLVTHDLVALAAVCDHVAVLRDGVVVERGRVGEVLAAPHHEHTRELVEAAHSLVPRTLPRETV